MGEGCMFDNTETERESSYESRLSSLAAAPQRLVNEGREEAVDELVDMLDGTF